MTNQKLYTAAEAHRIDIERGGQGCIINFYTTQKWFGDHFNQEAWLPVTPEPEKIKEVCSPTYQELEAENAKFKEEKIELSSLLQASYGELESSFEDYEALKVENEELKKENKKLREKLENTNDELGEIAELRKRVYEIELALSRQR